MKEYPKVPEVVQEKTGVSRLVWEKSVSEVERCPLCQGTQVPFKHDPWCCHAKTRATAANTEGGVWKPLSTIWRLSGGERR